jgi:cleavage and polyadenylation specificity factor subunit 1
MQCYTELIPPSAVTHAVALPFLHSSTTNLVVAKSSLLQVFDVRRGNKRAENGLEEDDTEKRNLLVLIGEYSVSGTITALNTISVVHTKSGGDALLIAFKDAKLSLVEWDPENYKISTVSIHYYEGENITSQPFGASLAESESILTVDPRSRCAALKFGARHLAILPFRQTGDELMEGADDALDAEMDVAQASNALKRTQSGLNDASDASAKETPYKSSFVLPLTALDPALTHPVDIAFLHEYREPTFGILSATVQPSTALLETRKDILSYTVFTLDLEQRASTNLISATKLPSDLWKIVPLPLPVGGALLVGTNELLHVDQSGKTNAVAVNEFAKDASNFGMTDQSELNLKLEDCRVETLDTATGDLLVVLNDGSLAVLSFRLLGRNVNGLKVTPVSSDHGGRIVKSAPSCVATLHGSQAFVGSEDGDASLISWTKSASMLSRKRSHAQMLGQEAIAEEDEDGDDLDDDDLYASTAEPVRRTSSSAAASSKDAAPSFTFEVLDTLPSLGPLNSLCFGRSSASPKGQLEILAGIGRQGSSRLASMSKEIRPRRLNTTEFENAKDIWSVSIRGEDAASAKEDYDSLLFCFDGEDTKVFDINHNEESNTAVYTERTGGDFERDCETLDVVTLANGSRVVQIKLTEIKTYTAPDLSFEQAIPMLDEETDAEFKIVHASVCDPYLLAVREDSTVCIVRADENGEVEALENTIELSNRKWLSGCLYSGHPFAGECVLFLLGEDGDLHIFDLPSLEHIQSMPMLPFLPTVLSPDLPLRRAGAKETLTELLVADLGTKDLKQPYLILRDAVDDLTLYEPYFADQESGLKNIHFRKVPFSYLPKFDNTAMDVDENRPAPLKRISLGHYSAIHVPGITPTMIVKENCSLPKALTMSSGSVKAFTSLNHRSCESGFGVIENDNLVEHQLPSNVEFSSGWCIERTKIGEPAEEVRHVAFHDNKKMYVVATCKMVDFYFPEEDGRHQEQDGKFSQNISEQCTPLPPLTLHHEHIRLLLSLSMERRL